MFDWLWNWLGISPTVEELVPVEPEIVQEELEQKTLGEIIQPCSNAMLRQYKSRFNLSGDNYEYVGRNGSHYMYWKHLETLCLCLRNLPQKIYVGDACAYNGVTPGHTSGHSDWMAVDLCYPVKAGSPYTQTNYTPAGNTTQDDFLANLDCGTMYELCQRIHTVFDKPRILVGTSIRARVVDYVTRVYGIEAGKECKSLMFADSDPEWKHEPQPGVGGHIHIFTYHYPVWGSDVFWL